MKVYSIKRDGDDCKVARCSRPSTDQHSFDQNNAADVMDVVVDVDELLYFGRKSAKAYKIIGS
jgi:hypothetical protein